MRFPFPHCTSVVLTLAATVATASPLPPALGAAICSVNGQQVTGQSCSLDDASASFTKRPAVLLQTNVSAPAKGPNQSAFASLRFWLEVTGGQAGDVVPVILSFDIDTQSTNGNFGVTEISVGGLAGGTSGDYNGTYSMASSNVSGLPDLVSVIAGAELTGSNGGSVSTTLSNPKAIIDPGFAGASNYSIKLSNGVTAAKD